MVRRAIVCGSGVGGLGAAIALAMKDWQVDVYERASAVREIGAGIFLKANGLRVLEHLGLLDRLSRDCVALQRAQTLDKDGTVLQSRTLDRQNPVWNIQRQLLIRALHDRATGLGVRVHTGQSVDAVSPSGSIRLADRTVAADLVVAADGVHSTARRALGLDRPVAGSRSGAIRLLVPRAASEADDIVRETWSGRLRVGITPCSRTELFIYFIAPLEDGRGRRLPIDKGYWSAHFPSLAAQGLFERAARAEGVHHPYPYIRTRSWVAGSAALVGDAAHALPPTLGQGAGLALTNALLLSHYVSARPDVPGALAAWEREWRWISERTQTWSRRYDWITSEWPHRLYPLRSAVIWGIGKLPRFNGYMRIADRIDAPNRRILPAGRASAPAVASSR